MRVGDLWLEVSGDREAHEARVSRRGEELSVRSHESDEHRTLVAQEPGGVEVQRRSMVRIEICPEFGGAAYRRVPGDGALEVVGDQSVRDGRAVREPSPRGSPQVLVERPVLEDERQAGGDRGQSSQEHGEAPRDAE